jgi:hypothetical protein
MDIAERINEAQKVWESGHLAAEAEYLRAAKFALITVLCFLPLALGHAFAPTVQSQTCRL